MHQFELSIKNVYKKTPQKEELPISHIFWNTDQCIFP